MPMRVSHESPIALLEESLKYNDYQYCLVHLLDENEAYRKFFLQARDNDQFILLDNSIFELGTAFDPDKYAYWIKTLRPYEYIVPDALEDSKKTCDNFDDWLSRYGDLPGRKIGVVQGKFYNSLVNCYRYMEKHADKIAISFDYSYYDLTGLGNTIWHRYMSGRQKFIRDLHFDNVWCESKPHHLLGAALPQEFKFYRKTVFGDQIETIDTSNPVIAGMFGTSYTDTGLDTKITKKLAHCINDPITEEQRSLILTNIENFRKINEI